MIIKSTAFRNTFDLASEKPVIFNPSQNSWVEYHTFPTSHSTGYMPPYFYKDNHNFVRLGGLMAGGTIGAIAHLLPNSYAPIRRHIYSVASASNALSRLDVRSQITDASPGSIFPVQGTNTFMSLEGVYYPLSLMGWVTPTLTSSWVAYGAASALYHQPAYYIDPFGFVHLTGLIKSGGTGSGNPIFTLPAGFRPSSTEIFMVCAAGAYGEIRVDNNGLVYLQTGGNSDVSLSGIYFMSSSSPFINEWVPMSLLNSWVDYGTVFQVAEFWIDPAGLLHTRGLIKSGTTTAGTPYATLPNYVSIDGGMTTFARPSNGAYGRVDYNPNGNTWDIRIANSAWLSISGMYHRLNWNTYR